MAGPINPRLYNYWGTWNTDPYSTSHGVGDMNQGGYNPNYMSSYSGGPAPSGLITPTGPLSPQPIQSNMSAGGGGMGGALGAAGSTALNILGMGNPLFGIGTGVLGLVNTIAGFQGLSELGDAPKYEVGGELQNAYRRAEGMTTMGLTPEEMASAKGNITRSNNAAYRNAVDMSGGNLSGAIKGALNARDLNAYTDLAALDASTRRGNIRYSDSLASQIQNIQTMQDSNEIDQYNKAQQAYGQAAQSGLVNIADWLNMLKI